MVDRSIALLFASSLIFISCKMNSSSKNDSGSSAGLASITMRDVSQSTLPHDKFAVEVRDGNGQILGSYNQPSELAAQKFKAGTTVMIGLKLFQKGQTVAKTTDGSKTCPPVTKTLKSGNNSFQIPLCKVDGSGKESDDTIVTPPSDGNSNANVEVEPCIAGSSGCAQTPDAPSGDPGSGGGGNIGGRCILEDGVWQSANGGCRHVPTRLTVSSVGNSNGTPYEMTHMAAVSYCSAPWRLPTRAEVDSIRGSGLSAHILYYREAGSSFWTADRPKSDSDYFYTTTGISLPASSTESVLCVR